MHAEDETIAARRSIGVGTLTNRFGSLARAAMTLLLLAAMLPTTATSTAYAAKPSLYHAVASLPAPIIYASSALMPLQEDEARISFIGHSTFLIESAADVKIATDYNDYYRPSVLPDIVTMNRAHNTHYTNFPSPDIRHVLRGWNPDGGPARHDVELRDVRVRNVPTNIRGWGGDAFNYGNSIFIFEMAGLCIGHLGHLQHTLTPQQVGDIGQLDIVLVAVDGGYTLDIDGIVEVLRNLRARLVIPMHYFNSYTLNRFTERIAPHFPVEMATDPTLVISRATLPLEPRVLVLPGP